MLRLLGFTLLIVNSSIGTGLEPDTDKYKVANLQYDKVTASSDLYYGTEHLPYPAFTEGFAYFQSPDWLQGSVTYNNVVYKDVSLKYDLLTDQLIVLHPNNIFAVTLFKERVQSFTIGNNHFISVSKNNDAGLKPGYYHQIIIGKLSILAKRSKVIEEKTTTQVEKRVISKDQFYAVKDGMFRLIKSEDSIMEMVGNQSANIRKMLRSKEIKFRTNKELALIEIATYYNQSAQ